MNKECIFCKKNKYKRKVLEKLMQFLEFRAVDSIKISATLKNDFMMLILLSQDLIVLEGHYHKNSKEILQGQYYHISKH